MANQKILLLHCFARSGGTLLNKYLNSYKNILCLSEAHPLHNKKDPDGVLSIKGQMETWHGIEVSAMNYADQIRQAYDFVEKNEKIMIIRDWTYADYVNFDLNNNTPPNSSVNYEILRHGYTVERLAFIRNPIDVYLSNNLKIEAFAESYNSYIRYLENEQIEAIKYEDFCSCPDIIKNKLESIFSKKLIKGESNNTYDVNGDIKPSRGNIFNQPIKLKRRLVPAKTAEKINHNKLLISNCLSHGYTPDYYADETEHLTTTVSGKWEIITRSIKKKLKVVL